MHIKLSIYMRTIFSWNKHMGKQLPEPWTQATSISRKCLSVFHILSQTLLLS